MEPWDYATSLRAQIRERLESALAQLDTDNLHAVALDVASANATMMTLLLIASNRQPSVPRIGGGVVVTDCEVR